MKKMIDREIRKTLQIIQGAFLWITLRATRSLAEDLRACPSHEVYWPR